MKDFEARQPLKRQLDERKRPPSFGTREVWWCHVGVNVGFEVFGKGAGFTRPVLIVKKYSGATFLGIPLTTKHKEPVYRYPMHIKGEPSYALLDQVRTMDARRLNSKIEKISEIQFSLIKDAFVRTVFDL